MEKRAKLEELLKDEDGFILAYSGGVSSSFLAYVLKQMDKEFVAVTVDNGMLANRDEIERSASRLGVEHRFLKLDLLSDRVFIENTEERCYFCKKGMIRRLREFGRDGGYSTLVDASNTTDLLSYRAGVVALMEERVFLPMVEVDISREDIAKLAEGYGLEVKPPESCLATRVPVDRWIRREDVEKIRSIERGIASLGFSLVRGRLHDSLVRLELLENEMEGALQLREDIQEIVESVGLEFAAVDLAPYSGEG